VIEEGDEAVLGVPGDEDDLAAFLEQGRRQHAQGKVGLDDPARRRSKRSLIRSVFRSFK
jgi:hypothetical protein